MMRREKLEDLVATRMIKRKCKILDVPTKWLNVGWATYALKAPKDRVWQVMIAYAKEQAIWLIVWKVG